MTDLLNTLAMFGGAPSFDSALHVGRPNIGDRARFHERLDDMLDRRWLSNNGPYVQEFETAVATLVGVKNCIALCNATVALEIAIRALDLSGEVIVPSFTFIATAHALEWLGITPVFCDVDPHSHNIDPAAVEALITDRTTGIIGVHLWGRGSDVGKLSDIAQRYRLRLMFDAAHAFGCSYAGKMVGGFGDCEVFSFHATKFFNTFEGGAIVTDNDELARRIRLMSNFGFAGYDTVVSLGTNGKMSEVAAAMGLTGLESLATFIDVNRRNYLAYQGALDSIPGVSLLSYDESEQNNYQYIVLEIDEEIVGVRRDQLVDILWAENVMARRYFYPGCHNMEPYRTRQPNAALHLPETERLVQRVLVLPTGTAVTSDDIETICGIIRFVALNGNAVRRELLRQGTITIQAAGG
jgi:dTDP-4-amino-4,6-dideoxygalactose transaminase